jgi:hypothetical protein
VEGAVRQAEITTNAIAKHHLYISPGSHSHSHHYRTPVFNYSPTATHEAHCGNSRSKQLGPVYGLLTIGEESLLTVHGHLLILAVVLRSLALGVIRGGDPSSLVGVTGGREYHNRLAIWVKHNRETYSTKPSGDVGEM